jgi:hypothetical protein
MPQRVKRLPNVSQCSLWCSHSLTRLRYVVLELKLLVREDRGRTRFLPLFDDPWRSCVDSAETSWGSVCRGPTLPMTEYNIKRPTTPFLGFGRILA